MGLEQQISGIRHSIAIFLRYFGILTANMKKTPRSSLLNHHFVMRFVPRTYHHA